MVRGARTDLAQICAMSQEEAAALVGISERSLQKAKKVQDEAVAELTEAGGCRTGRRRKCWGWERQRFGGISSLRQMAHKRPMSGQSQSLTLRQVAHPSPMSPAPPAAL
jgi:hypothetical protein